MLVKLANDVEAKLTGEVDSATVAKLGKTLEKLRSNMQVFDAQMVHLHKAACRTYSAKVEGDYSQITTGQMFALIKDGGLEYAKSNLMDADSMAALTGIWVAYSGISRPEGKKGAGSLGDFTEHTAAGSGGGRKDSAELLCKKGIPE